MNQLPKTITVEEKKDAYLKIFNRENDLSELGWGNSKKYGEEIVKLLQEKEGLTYEEAYASLQYAYNLLKYNSNFVLVNNQRDD
ncbi:hypothetical protein PFZ79_001064 [Enterococcus hirae]|nr:hypothetical protein [Enterococcus hirae]